MKTLAYVFTTAVVVHLATVYTMTEQAREETKPEFASTLVMCEFIFNNEKVTKEMQAVLVLRMQRNSTADEWKDFNKHCLTKNIQLPTK
ncbi:MAG: hypothetical protein KAF91_28495 [Nostoc sp. TH1S01]|nr:hypothetical protein [Nostoc sp. TH1S01]